MTNPRGIVSFEVGDEQFKWCFSVGAICALEDHLDLGLFAITEELQSWLPPAKVVDGKPVAIEETPEAAKARNGRVRMSFLRNVFWAGLQDHHPGFSIKMAGDLIGQVGGLIPALGIVVKGLGAAMPDPEETKPSPRQASRKKRAAG